MRTIIISISGLAIFASCAKETCDDGILNQDETAIDCGGSCTACETCTDGILNQDEVAVDCGGVCSSCPIEFPATGTYGQNLLSTEDTIYISPGMYSLRVVVPDGSTFKTTFKQFIGGGWGISDGAGWIVSDYVAGAQTFEAISATCDYQFNLDECTGYTFQVWYYENSASVTQVRYIVVG